MKTAYLDCFAGISGDMLLGALLDAGMPIDVLRDALATLPLDPYRLVSRSETRKGIRGTRFLVDIPHAEHAHRRLGDVRRIIRASALSEAVKASGEAVFEILARAEATVHGVSPEEVTFHEVGAVDSIVDIMGGVFGIAYFGIAEVYASPLPLGRGFVKSAHGNLPLPAPATLEILSGFEVVEAGLDRETVTPTGAALVKYLAGSSGAMPPLTLTKVAYGLGSQDFPDRPNCLRLLIGETAEGKETETVLALETNLDDANPEWLGFTMERLLEAGALDVVFVPVQMKKNRPGVQVQVLAHPHQKEALTRILFQESTTLGVRFHYLQRETVTREAVVLDSPWGPLRAKRTGRGGEGNRLVPEFEACREVALAHRVPLRDVFAWVLSRGSLSSE